MTLICHAMEVSGEQQPELPCRGNIEVVITVV